MAIREKEGWVGNRKGGAHDNFRQAKEKLERSVLKADRTHGKLGYAPPGLRSNNSKVSVGGPGHRLYDFSVTKRNRPKFKKPSSLSRKYFERPCETTPPLRKTARARAREANPSREKKVALAEMLVAFDIFKSKSDLPLTEILANSGVINLASLLGRLAVYVRAASLCLEQAPLSRESKRDLTRAVDEALLHTILRGACNSAEQVLGLLYEVIEEPDLHQSRFQSAKQVWTQAMHELQEQLKARRETLLTAAEAKAQRARRRDQSGREKGKEFLPGRLDYIQFGSHEGGEHLSSISNRSCSEVHKVEAKTEARVDDKPATPKQDGSTHLGKMAAKALAGGSNHINEHAVAIIVDERAELVKQLWRVGRASAALETICLKRGKQMISIVPPFVLRKRRIMCVHS